ncbi:cell wall anchor domain-containing [Micractinium conductrix]|uniref:Cell wall anchor domain-containing n=1 Tax=Micractinium conductrix TaxID=554055 RepID=A0A2P6VEA7_9CHLO|nr:cell wall anchor domain-containing [Micractinium conductrix]|eukprot:PSC72422.1 cell wall anchor domain-containing [Micractinium conductrix]
MRRASAAAAALLLLALCTGGASAARPFGLGSGLLGGTAGSGVATGGMLGGSMLGGGLLSRLRGGAAQPVLPAPVVCPAGAPAPIGTDGLKVVGANGVIELAWAPVPCATGYALLVDREDIPADRDNELSFTVAQPLAVVKNVANGSPYIVEIRACSGSQCSDKVALRVTPSGSVAPTMPVAGAQPATPAQPAIPAQQQPAVPAQPAQPALGIMAQPQSLAGWRVVMKNPTATA